VVDEALGRLVDARYRVERLIGRGGVGAVYEATELVTGRRVAVKLVEAQHGADENIASRFAREAKAASAVVSDHIVRVLDSGRHDGRPFLVMELLVGEDLGARLRRDRRISIDDMAHVVAQILRGLVGAHAAGIVHRDLKPDNILLVERGADRAFVKIVDFGTSKIQPLSGKTAPLSLTRRGVAVGTPLYMSPEQAEARSDVDERSDLYSVGALAFECLTGRPPHVGETDDEVIAAICTRDAPPVRDLAPATPGAIAAFVDKALARNREARFSSAREMLDALATAAAAGARASGPPTPTPRSTAERASGAPVSSGNRRPSRRSAPARAPLSPWTWVAAAGAALSGVVATAWVASLLRPATTAGSEVVMPLPTRSTVAAVSATAPGPPPRATPEADASPADLPPTSSARAP
jgi:serine/threonine protein kinase